MQAPQGPFLTLLEALGEGCVAHLSATSLPAPPLPYNIVAWMRVPVLCLRSSFGKVFKALHHASNKVVAVKVVPLEDDSGEVAREIEHLRECDQPNIVQYVGSFVNEERLWIMMEYCEGSSLLDIMAATGRYG